MHRSPTNEQHSPPSSQRRFRIDIPTPTYTLHQRLCTAHELAHRLENKQSSLFSRCIIVIILIALSNILHLSI